jgi:hypothetical protein
VDFKHLASFNKTLIFDGKWLYILLPEYSTTFYTIVKFVEGKCKLWLKRVFKSWISELDWNRPLFLLIKTSNEEMYWDGSESISICLHSWWHETWLPVFVTILIILFWILKMLLLWCELPQKIIPWLNVHKKNRSFSICPQT